MGRGKLTLELIGNEKKRKATFKKRKEGLIKKADEFSTLCSVDTCVIIYGTPAITDRPEEPVVWPADRGEVERIIQRYMSEGIDRRTKRSVGLPDLFINRRRKLEAELVKARSAVWEAKYPVSDDLISGFTMEQLRSLLGILGHRLEGAKKRLAALKEKDLAVVARDNLDVTGMLGFDHHSDTPDDFRHGSFYLHGNAGCIDHMNLPYHQYNIPNLHFLPNPTLQLELMGTGFGGGGVHHPSQTHNEVAPSDARLLTGNIFHHHYNYQMHNCFGGVNQYQYPMHEQEPCGDFGGGVNIGFCDSSSSAPYYDVPARKQIPGHIHQFQFEVMNMMADDPSTVHHQMHADSPFDQFLDPNQHH